MKRYDIRTLELRDFRKIEPLDEVATHESEILEAYIVTVVMRDATGTFAIQFGPSKLYTYEELIT